MNGYDMTTTNKTQAFATLNQFANARVELIKGMKDAGYTLETARDVVIEWACEKTGAAYNVKASGKVTLDSGHKKYEAAKTVVRDVMHMMAGTTRRAASAKKEAEAKVVIIGCDTIAEARAAFEAALAKKFAK